jgi:hypothetical protein
MPEKPDENAGAPVAPQSIGRNADSSPAFDPDTVQLLGSISEAVVRELEVARPDLMTKSRRSQTFAVLTKHLLAAALAGERDPETLKRLALKAMTSS